ncbi:MAG: carbon-nitrogen family hydrolase [Anaerolineae bacterium]
MRITVSLAQMDVQLGQPERNLARARDLVAEAKRRGSDIVLLPELWATGYDLDNAAKYATPADQGLFAATADLAREHSIHIAGSLLSTRGGHIYNTAVLFAPTGEALGEYSKIHLFRLMEEEKYLTAGDQTPVFDLPWGKSALAICYDLRFPELFRKYALGGAVIVFLVAEWPHPRLAHWRTLLWARAIENQCFVVACNRVGESKGQRFFGHSAIYDPWGEIVVEGGEGEILLTAEIDLDLVEEVRRRIPVFADRRGELY